MTSGLYYYKLVSPYPEDVTKNCKLSINEIDSNFFTLKNADISSVTFVKEDKTLVLTRNNGEKLIAPLENLVYSLNVDTECGKSGTTLSISYEGTDGKKEVTIPNILTAENLLSVIGSDILTKVITDGTLRGDGTINSPLGINGVEKTGMLGPAIEVLDLTTGGTLPEVAKLGTRYITKEYVHDYGYLYNGAGTTKIQEKLREEYVAPNASDEDIKIAWRIPTKEDWDVLLNAMEPCDYQNHNSARCHVELGKYAGKYLKSECGWIGQPECDCTITKPNTGCAYNYEDSYIDDETTSGNPSISQSPIGVDKYGMSFLPSGVGLIDTFGKPQSINFKEQAVFWSTTHIYNDCEQDIYAKVFEWNRSGVVQVAECPEPYYAVRLVKNYNGSNYYDSEYIGGILYKTILFPESGQIWLASNYCDRDGFIGYEEGGEKPEYVEVNNGQVLERRVEMFINEWNGRYWEKKIMHEGDTVVIENPCFDQGTGSTTEVCWQDAEEVRHCVEIEIPKVSQSNIEYRVYTEDDSCNKVLINTDDLVVERIIHLIVPMIEKEREERISGDAQLWDAIIQEANARMEVDNQLWDAIAQEASARTEVDNQLWDAIAQEASARTEVDNQLWDAIIQEANARTEVDNQLWDAIAQEASARTEVDNQLWEGINGETARAQEVEAQLWEGINGETARAQEVEAQLWEGINNETARAQEVEAQLWDSLNAEIERATAREDEIDGQLIDVSKNPYILKASSGSEDETNMTFQSKDGNEEHFIKIKFDGNFGEI